MKYFVLAICVFAASAPGATGPETLKFTKLETSAVPDSMALSEDGRHLAIACEQAGVVEIRDVATETMVAKLNTVDPRFLLWRGDLLLVANCSPGTISVFSRADWKLKQTVQTGTKQVYYLSAPEGKAFNGTVMATCETLGGCTIVSVDTSHAAPPRVCGNLDNGIALVSPDGKWIVEQKFYIGLHSTLDAYDSTEYLRGLRGQPLGAPGVNGAPRNFLCEPVLYVRGEGYGQHFRGTLPSLFIRDQSQDVDYTLSESMLVVSSRTHLMGRAWKIMAPRGLISFPVFRFPQNGEKSDISPRGKLDRFHPSQAVTVQGRMHVFIQGPDLAIYTVSAPLEVPAATIETKHAPMVQAVGDLPNGENAFEKAPVSPDAQRTFALTEDGKTFLLNDFKQNCVYVWDVETGKLVRKIETPQPVAIMTRGKLLFVCCQGKRCIEEYRATGQWEHLRDFKWERGSGQHLAAARGAAFDGNILVDDGTLLDTKSGKFHTLYPGAGSFVCQVDAAGHRVLEFEEFVTPKQCRLFDYAPYISGRADRRIRERGAPQDQEVPEQYHANGPWFTSRCRLYAEHFLEPLGIQSLHAAAPDVVREVYYELGNGKVIWHKADVTQQVLGSRAVLLPKTIESGDFRGVASTLGQSVYILGIDASGDLYRFKTDSTPAPDDAPAAAGAPGEEYSLPTKVVEGRSVNARVKGGTGARYQIVKGPAGLVVLEDGKVQWTPTRQDVGTVEIKIRVERGGDTTFQRYSVQVIAAADLARAGNEVSKVGQLGIHRVSGRDFYLGVAGHGDGIVLLDGLYLRVLDADGLAVKREAYLQQYYSKLVERKGYWLAVDGHAIDVLDDQTFAVRRHIPIECTEVLDIVTNPVKPRDYITRSVQHTFVHVGTVIELDEQQWTTRAIPGVYADRVAVEPGGRIAYVSVGQTYQLLLTRKDWSRFGRTPFDNRIESAVIAYDLSRNWTPINETLHRSGGSYLKFSGSVTSISPDGKLLVSLGVSDDGVTPALDTSDIRKSVAGFKLSRGRDFSFHPFLNLVAAADDGKLLLLDRQTGNPAERRVDFGDQVNPGALRVLFSPGGSNLLVGCDGERGGTVVRSFPLILSAEERQALVRSPNGPRPAGIPQITVAPPKPARVSLHDLDAISKSSPGPELTAAALGRKYMPAVVLVESREAFGTGFFVGSGGYVLTCAHVLPRIGETTIRFHLPGATEQLTRTAVIASVDEENDLALLKINVPGKVAVVHLSSGEEITPGEPVTVIGNPGLGMTVLQSTLTTGVVSNADRAIRAKSYVQTSAPVNPGNSGGPMFDSHGDVIGVVVLKAGMENTAFAVPPTRFLGFLHGLENPAK